MLNKILEALEPNDVYDLLDRKHTVRMCLSNMFYKLFKKWL